MILAPHVLIGAAIASKTAHPLLGILFAFLSHYLVDTIPHAEYGIDNLSEQKRNRAALQEFSLALVDVSLGMLLVFFLVSRNERAAWILAAGFAAALPDAIGVLGEYFLPKPIHHVVNLGHELHTKNKNAPFVIGVATQFAASALAVFILLI